MSVPKEVILDLLPVYLAGEVSSATKAWVEEQLAQNPALAEQVRRQQQRGSDSSVLGQELPPLPPGLEVVALQRTRRMLAMLRWLFGLGIAFTATALALKITLRPVFSVRPLVLDYPAQLGPCLAAGVLCWIAYFRLKRRLRSTAS